MKLFQRLGVRYPIIQAPMAGSNTVELVAAVSNAGGLGSFAAMAYSPPKLRQLVESIRQKTDKPFNINLFVQRQPKMLSAEEFDHWSKVLRPFRRELGIEADPAPPSKFCEDFEAQVEALVELRVPVVSFAFGTVSPEVVARLKSAGTFVMATATTVAEGKVLRDAGVDAVCAQGSEAGGHRGTFLDSPELPLVGTMALVPQLVDAVAPVPVIAAGGIMDGRGIRAALELGAEAVQLGTAFLLCPEVSSTVGGAYAERLHAAGDESTTITRVLSGRHVRTLRNRLLESLEAYARDPSARRIPEYSVWTVLCADIKAAARAQKRADLLSGMWAGQGVGLIREMPAAELVATLAREAGLQ
eukprot:TRINITY_DN10786_c0_g1_i1.p2 TRINITY_DN10786_c0_g1~~TRINITY_DN10786_c0_g1_i1.p2  ORF type:complete len:358 (-),score=132.40 TRINITY_DN10786_c0_g1_i1:5-1078(-)